MRLQVSRCSEGSKSNLSYVGAFLPADDPMLLWEVKLKDLGWRWQSVH